MIILTKPHADILTPELCAKSKCTQDIKFFDLCGDYDLQFKLKFATAAFLMPAFSFQQATKKEDMPLKVANYLAQFKDKTKQQETKNFLLSNPVLRILWKG